VPIRRDEWGADGDANIGRPKEHCRIPKSQKEESSKIKVENTGSVPRKIKNLPNTSPKSLTLRPQPADIWGDLRDSGKRQRRYRTGREERDKARSTYKSLSLWEQRT